jgi:hypothetical protein
MSGDLFADPGADQRVGRGHSAVVCDAPFGQSAIGKAALRHTKTAGAFRAGGSPIGESPPFRTSTILLCAPVRRPSVFHGLSSPSEYL